MKTLPQHLKNQPPGRAAMPGAPERKSAGGREVRSFALQIKSISDEGVIEGYGSVFGVPDSYDDVVAAGAFAKSLADHKAAGTMPAMLWQHGSDHPIGVWTEMVEDAKGLRVKGQLAMEVAKGKEAYALLKMGAVNGLSIGFVSKEWSSDRDTDMRTLNAVDLWEVSLVTFPANGKSRVTNVKSADELSAPKDAERILRDAGFSKTDATAFVSRVMRMGEERSDSADSTAKALKAAQRLLENLSKP
jgi:HK97 family phage prohead protease